MTTYLTKIEVHPWVTKGGTDPLLSAEDNAADLVEPPTEEETNEAITGKFSNMLVIVRNSHQKAHHILKFYIDESRQKVQKRYCKQETSPHGWYIRARHQNGSAAIVHIGTQPTS